MPFCRVRLARQVIPAGYPCVLNNLGDHLKKRRLDLGLQLKQAADALGCHAASVANWEAGRREPATRHLPRLTAFLGYDPRPKVDVLADRLKSHRTALGFSLKAAAEQIGVDPGTLTRWERGRRQPEASTWRGCTLSSARIPDRPQSPSSRGSSAAVKHSDGLSEN